MTSAGTPLNKSDVEVAFNAVPEDIPSAVIVALNSVRSSDNPWAAVASPPRLMADSHANLTAVMKEYGVKKIVTMSAFGAGDSFYNLNVVMRLIIKKSNMVYTFQDHDLVDHEIKESGVDYVLVRPALLKGEGARPVKFHGSSGKGSGWMPSISRKSVADFLLDAAEQDTWDRSALVISN